MELVDHLTLVVKEHLFSDGSKGVAQAVLDSDHLQEVRFALLNSVPDGADARLWLNQLGLSPETIDWTLT